MGNINNIALERPAARAARLEREAERAAREAIRDELAEDVPPAEPADEVASRPLRKTREGWRLLRGTEPWAVAVKAVALLAVLWALSATRYLPTPADIALLLGIGL